MENRRTIKPVVDRVKKHGDSWKERKERILEQLGTRVQALVSATEALQEIPADLEPEEFGAAVDQIFAETVSALPERAQVLYRSELSGLKSKLFAAKREADTLGFDELMDQIDAYADNPSIDNEHARATRLQEQYQEAMNNPDIALILTLESVSTHIKRKNIELSVIRNNPQLTATYVNDVLESRGIFIDEDDIKRIEWSAFEIRVVLNPESYTDIVDWNRKSPTAGIHYRNTAISLIRGAERIEDEESTIQHESIHNMLDGVTFEENGGKSAYITRAMDRAVKMADRDTPEGSSGTRQIIRQEIQILQSRVNELINSEKEELLAHLEIIEKEGIPDKHGLSEEDLMLSVTMSVVFERDEIKSTVFDRATRKYSTAGNRIYAVSEALRKKANSISEQDIEQSPIIGELKNAIEQARSTLEGSFVRVLENIKVSAEVSRRLGPEAEAMTHTLYYLLQPSQYRVIMHMLRHTYGEASVLAEQTYDTRRKLLSIRADISPAFLTQTANLLEQHADAFTDEDIQAICSIAEMDFNDCKLYAWNTIEDIRTSRVAATRIAQAVNTPGVEQALHERIDYSAYRVMIELGADTAYATILADLPNYTEVERSELADTLYSTGVESADLYLFPSLYEHFTDMEWDTLPHWELFDALGVERPSEEEYDHYTAEQKELDASGFSKQTVIDLLNSFDI